MSPNTSSIGLRTFASNASSNWSVVKPLTPPPQTAPPKDLLICDPRAEGGVHIIVAAIIDRIYQGRPVPNSVRIFQNLSIHLWPRDQPALKMRVIAALAFLISAKLVNITVPFFFKFVIDGLAAAPTVTAAAVAAAPALPLAAVLGYGAARMAAVAFTELRTAVFSPVTQGAIRRVSLRIFRHVHAMDLGFHLARQTGAVNRTLDRGTRGIQFALSALLFNVIPTALEVSLVSGLLAYQFGWGYGAVALGTVVGYSVFTVAVSSRRVLIRREMNQAENQAGARAVDSLLNYETVKYFNAEDHEALRYNESLERFEKAAVKTATSLSFLNFGQGAIFAVGLTAMLGMSAGDVVRGAMTVGDVVMMNGLVFQLSLPLNFLGTVYRPPSDAI